MMNSITKYLKTGNLEKYMHSNLCGDIFKNVLCSSQKAGNNLTTIGERMNKLHICTSQQLT